MFYAQICICQILAPEVHGASSRAGRALRPGSPSLRNVKARQAPTLRAPGRWGKGPSSLSWDGCPAADLKMPPTHSDAPGCIPTIMLGGRSEEVESLPACQQRQATAAALSQASLQGPSERCDAGVHLRCDNWQRMLFSTGAQLHSLCRWCFEKLQEQENICPFCHCSSHQRAARPTA